MKRLLSLDAFRGYTIAGMIMVNFPGSWEHVYPTLQHSDWNGLTFTDLIAPFFLFIIGVSIQFAYGDKASTAINKTPIYKKIWIRSLKIFAIGMFLNAMPLFQLNELRWTGTLHRIAIVFGITASLFLVTGWKQQAALTVFLLLGYWIVLMGIPTPGYGKVMLEPGVNIAAWVDSKYLPGKMWQGTWDPEGILSTFPSIATCLTGVLAGKILRLDLPVESRLNRLFSAGALSAALGYFLGLVFPVNENLWTSSFVLVTSGIAAIVLAGFYFCIDVMGYQKWAKPGVILGMNAIVVYIAGDVLSLLFYQLPMGGETLNQKAVFGLTGFGLAPELASWCYALFFVGVIFGVAYFLYRKKLFIKV